MPSELKGLYLAWQRHGKLPWSRLVSPAAALAAGHLINEQTAQAIAAGVSDISKNAALASVLMPHGVALKVGDTLANPALATFLGRVGAVGPDAALYRNPTAAALLAAEVRAAGGILTAADVMGYNATLRTPLNSSVMGLTLLGVPPPSSGGAAVALIAQLLGGYPGVPAVGLGSGL